MSLHGGTPFPQALRQVTASEARDFFGSKAFGAYRTSMEARQKLWANLFGRFDNVMRGINVLAKVMSARRGR